MTHFGRSLARSSQGPMSALSKGQGEIPLTAVFLLSQDAGLSHPHISSISCAAAFSRVLSHAYCFDEGDALCTRRITANYLELVASATILALSYPPNFEQLPSLVNAVVEAAGSVNSSSATLRRASAKSL